MTDLPTVWAGLIAFAIFAYVVLDGFDLGIGMLFPALASTEERDTAMASVAPVWDGNETWLVLGGGGLFAVFPLAYAILMPAFYAPITAMLLGLVMRGVAFEFRGKTRRGKAIWDAAFAGGSTVAALAQGLMLGTIVQGVTVANRAYAGGWFDWLTPFSALTALSVAIGYTLLGTCWLIMKTSGSLQARAYSYAWPLALSLLAGIGAVSLWTPFLNPQFLQRWFSWPHIAYVAPVPVLTALAAARLLLSLKTKRETEPFLMALALFALCFAGLGVSLFPSIVPPAITIWDAAAPPESLRFLLIGAAVLIPIILGYTAFSYSVFRGKVRDGEHYH